MLALSDVDTGYKIQTCILSCTAQVHTESILSAENCKQTNTRSSLKQSHCMQMCLKCGYRMKRDVKQSVINIFMETDKQ